MTLRELLHALLRRWYLPLTALLMAGAVGFTWLQSGGCYTTTTVVAFTLPSRATLLPQSGLDDVNVIAFAGVVAQEINGGRPIARYASREAPLYGVGVRQGLLVALPDSGSQWASSFARAEIEIQIVGRTHDEVAALQQDLLDRVFLLAAGQQASSAADQRIQASIAPLTTSIQQVTATRLGQLIALVALATAALIVGGWAAVRLDRRMRRRAAAARRRNDEQNHEMEVGHGPR